MSRKRDVIFRAGDAIVSEGEVAPKRGRPRLGDAPMTNTERSRKHVKRVRAKYGNILGKGKQK